MLLSCPCTKAKIEKLAASGATRREVAEKIGACYVTVCKAIQRFGLTDAFRESERRLRSQVQKKRHAKI